MRRALYTALVAAIALGTLGALGACSSSGAAGNEVTMSDSFVFEPKEITVAPGETITFSNTSSNVHTVTAVEDSLPEGAKYFASGGFSSEKEARDNISEGLLRAGDRYEVTLDKPGTYQYFCIPHESSGMAGTIVVEG
jgi:plastocyanin